MKQILIRISEEQHAKLKEEKKDTGASFSFQVRKALNKLHNLPEEKKEPISPELVKENL